MNTIDWIIIAVGVVSIIGIIILIVGKWQKMLLLDVNAMPKAKMRSKKYQIIEDRLQRKATGARDAAKKVFSPVGGKVSDHFSRFYGKLSALERKYRHAVVPARTEEQKEKTRQKIAALMEKGEQLYKEGNYGEAENIFLDVVRLDPQHVEAYEYLGEVYFQKKEYDHAIETLEFAKKLSPNEDRIYYDLGIIYQSQGDQEKTLECFKECVALAPNNPRNLDSLLTVAIETKDMFLAKETLKQLKEVNPENQKIEELEKAVKEL